MGRSRDWKELLVPLIPIGVGVAILLVSFLDPRDDAFPAGRPPVFFAGCAFLLAGLSILVQLLPDGKAKDFLAGVIPVLLLGSFAAIPLSFLLKSRPAAGVVLGTVACILFAVAGVLLRSRQGAGKPLPGSPTSRKALAAGLIATACATLAGSVLLLRPAGGGSAPPAAPVEALPSSPAGDAPGVPGPPEAPPPTRIPPEAEPAFSPEPSGAWTGEDWGRVELHRRPDGAWEGTYTGTYGPGPGTLRLARHAREEGVFSGRWREGDSRSGSLSIRLSADGRTAAGTWSADATCRIRPGDPARADLHWSRAE